jgi:hypothetical protein
LYHNQLSLLYQLKILSLLVAVVAVVIAVLVVVLVDLWQLHVHLL